MGKLYLRIWFAVVVTGVMGIVLGIIATRLTFDVPGQIARFAIELVASDQAIASGDSAAVAKRLDELQSKYGLEVRVLDVSGLQVAAAPPQSGATAKGADFVAEVVVDNGRHVQLISPPSHGPKIGAVLLGVLLIGLGVAAATYPIVRRITRRLERLKNSVELLGAGNFEVRMDMSGRDEVAALAKSFNEAAQRIAQLVESNRSLLANASHELRSPLARVRMAAELLAQKAGAIDGPEANEIRLSIRELDALIDEILTGSSLERVGFTEAAVSTNLSLLIRDECSRVHAHFEADPVTAIVHPVLYRRMVRNLLENAAKYGMGQPIVANLRTHNDRVELTVLDQGIGVPPTEAERIFEPFYRRKGASEVSGGVGLGLALAREIARRHGGDIDCRPNQPKGSIFRTWIPHTQPPGSQTTATTTKVGQSTSQSVLAIVGAQ